MKDWRLLRLGFVLLTLLASLWLGLRDGIQSYRGVETPVQRMAAILQISYGAIAFVALGTLLSRRAWLGPAITLWGAALVATALLAPVAWGGAPWSSGVVAALLTAVVAGLVIWAAVAHNREP